MIPVPSGVRVWLASGHTDMRKGWASLALLVQERLAQDPHSGHLFLFRGRRGDKIKILYYDTNGLCLFAKRLQRGRFVWPVSREGVVTLTPAELAMLVEGLDWRAAERTWKPDLAG
ncbi:IS66 family insertion sequence element accessory protein TnpB [Azospirillum brasilense]|uniref:IS66 family insertion sequence element accessory protein TnpB n=1 Tax=Azospirillum brasilense TaxID=192 RepID=UPI00039F2639|nr:IS66 family insertion sequence element accessory protein TnpB [Azospirillum brasilense]